MSSKSAALVTQGRVPPAEDWEVVEGRGLRGRVLYSLTRLSSALGLTSVDEDDAEYKQRVIGSELIIPHTTVVQWNL